MMTITSITLPTGRVGIMSMNLRTSPSAGSCAGRGSGRLSVVLSEYADKITLVDASSQQLALAADFLADHPSVQKRLMDASSLDFPDDSVDLVAMVRVMHHLPDPGTELAEVSRI